MLFGDLRKKARIKNDSKSLDSSTATTSTSETIATTPSSHDDDLHGLEIKAYAKAHGITTEKTWDLIRTGKLIARTENGFIYVYGSNDAQPPLSQTVATFQEAQQDCESTNLPAVNDDSAAEIALLMDHLQLAKQQNIEILKLTQSSIEQIRSLSDQVIASKDASLAEKEQTIHRQNDEITALRERLQEEQRRRNQLEQSLEDYEMLAKTLELQ